MASINTGKVIVGGLAAGVVMNVIDFVSNMYILGDRMKADMDALNPVLWTNMNDMSRMPAFLAVDFVLGIVLVWLYAAIRPRFGAGAGTAMKAGLSLWLVGTAIFFYLTTAGMFSMGTFVYSGCLSLVNMLASAWVGAKLYSEAA